MSQRAFSALVSSGLDPAAAERALIALAQAGVNLTDASPNELVCHWIDVRDRAVPAEADTIIRTITTTLGSQSTITTHWLSGLRGPQPA